MSQLEAMLWLAGMMLGFPIVFWTMVFLLCPEEKEKGDD